MIGLGAMGSAVAYHLARRGAEVVGFDAFDVPNEKGSSGGESRIIRMCYFEHPDYVPLLKRAYELWHELARETGKPIIEITGVLFMGNPASELIAGSLRAAQAHDLPHEMLTAAQLRTRYPQFAVTDDMVGMDEPTGGLLRPELAIAAHAELARSHGARLHANEAVVEWEADGAGFVINTAKRTARVDSLVICAGAWTTKLVRELVPQLSVSRQVMAWVQPKDAAPFKLGSFPVWAMEHTGSDFHYGFPSMDDTGAIKLARHHPGRTIDPNERGDTPEPADENEVRPFLRKHMPAADGPLRALKLCTYTNTPDAHFLIDRHPQYANVHIAAGFSGHGFKFATVMGEALADLALTGETKLPIGFLNRSRLL